MRDELGHLGSIGPCAHGKSSRKPKEITLSETQLAYLAGIIDGEGSIGIRRQFRNYGKRVYRYPILKVVNTDRKLMEWLHETIGYAFNVQRPHNPPNGHAWKTLYQWQIENTNAKKILNLVIRFLIIKHQRALDVLAEFD